MSTFLLINFVYCSLSKSLGKWCIFFCLASCSYQLWWQYKCPPVATWETQKGHWYHIVQKARSTNAQQKRGTGISARQWTPTAWSFERSQRASDAEEAHYTQSIPEPVYGSQQQWGMKHFILFMVLHWTIGVAFFAISLRECGMWLNALWRSLWCAGYLLKVAMKCCEFIFIVGH